jgi:hypothetical protein
MQPGDEQEFDAWTPNSLNWPIIRKSLPWPGDVAPNVLDYDAARPTFTWDSARADLDGLPGGAGVNIAHEAVDRHAVGARAARVAFRSIGPDGSTTEATYAELAARTNRFANALHGLGIGKGDRVFTLLGRVPELDVTAIGTLKHPRISDARDLLARLLHTIAPEVDLADADPNASLQTELDLDSMDFLHLITALTTRPGSTSPSATIPNSPRSTDSSTTSLRARRPDGSAAGPATDGTRRSPVHAGSRRTAVCL